MVFPGEIHISSMTREKRMGMRGSLLLLEGGRRLRDGKGGSLTSEGIDEEWLQTEAEGLMCWMLIKPKPMTSTRICLNRASTEGRQEAGAMAWPSPWVSSLLLFTSVHLKLASWCQQMTRSQLPV